MTTYVEYELEDGGVLLVETETDFDDAFVKVSRDGGDVFVKASNKFNEALRTAKNSAQVLIDEFQGLEMDEFEITFGLKTTGEAGIFAVSKFGMEANYQIKLKWKKVS